MLTSRAVRTIGRILVIVLFSSPWKTALARCELGKTLFVSPDGDDEWTGELSSPNPSRSDGPLRSPVRARDRLRELRAAGSSERRTVCLRGGVYELDEPFRLGVRDSGTKAAPVTYEAYPGETPILSGGYRVLHWSRLGGVPTGGSRQAEGRIWTAAVRRHRPFQELFLDGDRLPRAVAPNTDRWEGWFRATASDGGGALRMDSAALRAIGSSPEAEVNLVPAGARFVNALLPIRSVEAERGVVRLQGRAPYADLGGFFVRLENGLGALDRPGEWSLDAAEGRVFLWAPDGVDPRRAEIVAPRLRSAIEVFGEEGGAEPVRYVRLEGLTVRHVGRGRFDEPPPPGGWAGLDTSDGAVLLSGVEDVAIEGLRIHGVGGMGIRVFGRARRLVVSGNEIFDCGGTGIGFWGGDAASPHVNGSHRIERNHVHDCGRTYWHGSGIHLAMTGDSRVSGNEVHDMPYAGILVTGQREAQVRSARMNRRTDGAQGQGETRGPSTIEDAKRFVSGNVVIERNRVRDVMQVLDDGGAIYSWGSHHNRISENIVRGCSRDFSFGIYLDAEELDSVIEGNVVSRCPAPRSPRWGSALLLYANGRNVVRRNVFAQADRLFRFRHSYGGHRVAENLFLFQGRPLVDETPDRDEGQPIDFGAAWMDGNLYWSEAPASDLRAGVAARREKGWDRNSRIGDPNASFTEAGAVCFAEGSPAFALGLAACLPNEDAR